MKIFANNGKAPSSPFTGEGRGGGYKPKTQPVDTIQHNIITPHPNPIPVKRGRGLFFTILLLTLLFLTPQAANAASFSFNCTPASGSGQYTEAVVKCIKQPVETAAISMMQDLSAYFKPFTTAIFTLAIVFFGISIMGLQSGIAPPSFIFILKLGLVSFFSYNLGGFASFIFGIFDQLLTLVSGANYSPWQQIDKFVGKLIGFATDPKHNELKDGIIGVIYGSFDMKKVIGGMLTIVGAMTLWTVLTFMFEAVFLYIASLMIVAFLIVISPLVIPFAIFNYGKQYVDKFLKILTAAILAPMIAFAVMFIFIGDGATNIGIFPQLVDNVLNILPPNYMDKNFYSDVPIVSQTNTENLETHDSLVNQECVDPATGKAKAAADCKPNAVFPPEQPNVNATTATSQSKKVTNEIDFGANDAQIKKQLLLALLNLFIFASIMKGMIKQVQSVAARIAGVIQYSGAEASSSPLATLNITAPIG